MECPTDHMAALASKDIEQLAKHNMDPDMWIVNKAADECAGVAAVDDTKGPLPLGVAIPDGYPSSTAP